MAEKGLINLGLRSQEDILEEAFRYLFDAYAELRRRGDITGDFFKSFRGFCLENRVWLILWESGGAQRFTDIFIAVGGGKGTLSKALMNLLNAGLVRMVRGRYQAVCPAWLVHFPEPNRRMV